MNAFDETCVLMSVSLPEFLIHSLTLMDSIHVFFSDVDKRLGGLSLRQANLPATISKIDQPLNRKSSSKNVEANRKRVLNNQKQSGPPVPSEMNQPKYPVVAKNDLTSNTTVQLPEGVEQNPQDMISTSQCLETGKKTISCKLCLFQAPTKFQVLRHVKVRHMTGGMVYKCTMCEMTTKLKENLKQHYRRKHKLPEELARSALY